MRINKFVAQATGLSRRAADRAIQDGRVAINHLPAKLGDNVSSDDHTTLDGDQLTLKPKTTTIMLNKPVGYVCSRNGQGSNSIYELLPIEYKHLKPAGRLDKNSSGLLIMTDDGNLAQELTHPSFSKTKIYHVCLDKSLKQLDQQLINHKGVPLEDGPSKLGLTQLDTSGYSWQVTMREGRNRQIRRTFAALGYEVTDLIRIAFGPYTLNRLPERQFCQL